MNKQNNKQKAFTLAEILIALTIIGVIAAITVPALIQRTQKQEYVSALKKAYSTLSQAANQIIAENGSPKCDDAGWACSSEEVYSMFKKYLIDAKDCGSGTGCFPPEGHQVLDSNTVYTYDNSAKNPKLVLSDGSLILFSSVIYKDCTGSWGGSINPCTRIWVDINGIKKPNKYGRDYFGFTLKENGLYPNGCDDESFCPGEKGVGCACKVLREGKMDY